MKLRQLFLYTILLFSFQFVSAQYYETGQDPASLKWKQIKTERFTVIFPENWGPGGMLYAKSLDEAYSKLTTLFPEKKFHIPVVIHSFSIQSNGYVAWAPKRMELYPTPEQNTIPLSPEKQLAIHELTHVLQMESLNQGFSKGMSIIFGEQFFGIVASLLPSWFLEGDAVFAESALTQSGRGRDPSFQKQLKALMIDNKIYKYDKILNGSYKDFVPDIYESGFQMVTLALTKKDPQIWNKVLRFTADEPFTLNPFNISLSRNSGLRKKTLWNETCDTLKTMWTKDVSKNNPEAYNIANPEKHGKYINYYSPVFAGKDSIIAIRTSLSVPSSFVLIDPVQKTEKRIHTPGQIWPWFISCARGKLVWVETLPDPRWDNREYSVVKMLDINTNTVRKLSRKSRYLAASISPDGRRIAAIENTANNINNLVLLSAETATVIESVTPPGNVYLQHPQWSADGKKITFIFLSEAGEGIMSFNFVNHNWKTLIDASRNNLQSSFLRNDSLFFISSSSGTDNIYLLTPDKKIIPVTRSKYGVVDANPGGDRIYFGDYTSLGNNICSTTIALTHNGKKYNTASSSFLLNRIDLKPYSGTDSSTVRYTSEPYRKWEHLFRFHSWMPFYADISQLKADPASVRPGITIMTQNTLSTLTSTIGYEYSAEKRNVFHSRITWSGWYPIIESQIDYGTIPNISKMGVNIANPSVIQPGISFLNTISIPLQFSSGRFSEYLRPSLSTDYINQYIYLKETGTYDYGQTIITGRLYFTNYDKSAVRDIYPKWAQTIDFNYCFAPFDRNIYGSAVSLKTAFYFPGLSPNNGIKIRLEIEKQDPSKYLYSNFSSLPRGYYDIIAKQIKIFSADYVFPLAYPDFNLASLLYLKRIRTGLFYDYAEGPGNSFYKYSSDGLVPLYKSSEKESFKSFGIELMADFHVLRIPFMISAGIQSAWKDINKMPDLEMLFNIDLFGMTLGRKK
jgi:Periplasmic component of the Tol biopolymer transport system